MSMPTRRPGLLFSLALLAFVSLGLPDGVLGVAWPSMRDSFARPLSDLGLLLAAAMVGYLASSFTSGPIVECIGVGRLLLWSSVVVVLSSLGYATSPVWPLALLAGVLAGLGAGAIDAGINAFAATHFPASQVTWLHASYGVGAMLGPLLVTGVLASGLSWRWGYAAIGALLSLMTLAFALTLGLWTERAPSRDAAPSDPGPRPAGFAETLRQSRTWTSVRVFFLYTGLEVTAGKWTYSLLTEGRGVAPATAGVWLASYWASLTLGRVVAGALAGRVPGSVLLGVATGSAPVAACLVWLGRDPLDVMGLALLGFTLAPIYPLLIAATPSRIGVEHADTAVGCQVAAAYLGTAALPGLAGVLARAHGLEVVGPFLVTVATALLLVYEATRRTSPGSLRSPLKEASR